NCWRRWLPVTHDPAAVAAYVAGELVGGSHAEFEEHLLACEDCWHEVEVGRRGRQLAGLGRESAPDSLRAWVMAEFAVQPPRRLRMSRLVTAAVAVAACIALVAGVVVGMLPDGAPTPMHAAVVEFHAGRLPGAGIPTTAAPDLTKIGLTQVAASA